MTYYAAVSTVENEEFDVVAGQILAIEFIPDETFISPETGKVDEEMKKDFFINCHNSISSFAAAKMFNPQYTVVDEKSFLEVKNPNPA